MAKNKIGSGYPCFVMPVCLVGANIDGKPNFEAIAWFSLVDYQPTLVSISSEKSHHTNRGIRENKTFSVNIPSTGMAAATDYCGIHSGSEVDKSRVFDVFYGELKTAPMISECPISIECKLDRALELAHGEIFIGEVVGIYMEDKYLTGNKPDIRKIDPLLFEGNCGDYWKLGEHVTKAFEAGRHYKTRNTGKEETP